MTKSEIIKGREAAIKEIKKLIEIASGKCEVVIVPIGLLKKYIGFKKKYKALEK